MPICVPISELKDTAAFARKVAQAGEPVIVTRNGYDEFVVIDPALFRSYRKETPEEELERLLAEADREVELGLVSDMRSGLMQIRDAYGL